MKRYIYLFLVFISTFCTPIAMAEDNIPDRPSNYVNDYAGIIDSYDEQRINQLCSELEKKTTAQIFTAIVNDTGSLDTKTYAVKLEEKWKAGQKGKDNGIIIVLNMGERRLEIETGYGLEGILPDGKVGEVRDQEMLPRFKAGQYGEGIYNGISAFAQIIEAEGGETSTSSENRKGSFFNSLLIFVFLPIIFILIFTKLFSGPSCPRCRKKMLVEEQIINPATEYHSGKGIRTYTCRECGHSYTKEMDIPRIVSTPVVWIDDNDDRHGGGGFFGGGDWSDNDDFDGGGGGRSGGGGAGGSW